ncbi:MAG: hypothetical protein HYV02_03625 [Deltaproteobacteria bacterium]|nr:hypothetical protein [Deltaproteobacteria bacterium]
MRILMGLIIFICSSLPPLVRAETTVYDFVLWYPGEAGSTAEAQPLMDLVGEYLAAKIPQTQWRVLYFAELDPGKNYIHGRRPPFGIVSTVAYWRFQQALQMTHLLATRPLPHGTTRERWARITGPCEGPGAETRKTFVTEPLTPAFHAKAFPHATPGNIVTTTNALKTVQDIAGEHCLAMVVNERLGETIGALGARWGKPLQIAMSQATFPTPSVVRFGTTVPPITEALTRTFLTMDRDPDGKRLLEELRLAGFR